MNVEYFEDEKVPETEETLWEKAIAEADRQFNMQEAMEELENPQTPEERKLEIYRILGAILLVVAVPVGAIVLIRKIHEWLSRRQPSQH